MPHVLIVEDETLIAHMVQGWLTELGCTAVGPAGTVAKALDLIKTSAVDAAILDISLGSSDCSAIADALRVRRVPFAFASGHTNNSLADRYPEAQTLPKPYDFAAVSTMVRRLLPSAGLPMQAG
jgi:DNA-binding response OmpR family regulator